MDWKQELLKRLDALAQQLGTTAQYLWHILVRQAYIEGVTDVSLGVIFGIATYIAYSRLRRTIAWDSKDRYDHWSSEKIACFVFSCIGLICVIPTYINLVVGIQELANPEFFALQQILEKLTK